MLQNYRQNINIGIGLEEKNTEIVLSGYRPLQGNMVISNKNRNNSSLANILFRFSNRSGYVL